MKTSKTLALLFSSLLLFMLPSEISRSCSFDYMEPLDYRNLTYFFDQTIIDAGAYEPLLYTQHLYHSEAWSTWDDVREENIAEWRKFFDDIPSLHDIDTLVYSFSGLELLDIEKSMDGDSVAIDSVVQKNSLVRYWLDHPDNAKKNLEAIDYLYYAKMIDLLTNGPYWSEEDAAKASETQQKMRDSLLDYGLQGFSRARFDDIRLRYAYQMVRMEHYGEEYEHAIALYDSLIEPIHSASPIRWWALGNKAGCLRNLHREAEAAYSFSRVFDECPSRRASSYLSFRIKNDTVWQQSLALCKSDHERTILNFLTGIADHSKSLEEMTEIHRLEPGSIYLEILLVREIVKLEDELNEYRGWGIFPPFNKQENDAKEDSVRTANLTAMDSLVNDACRQKDVRTPDAWKLSLGYLRYLERKPNDALEIYASLRTETHNPQILSSVEICTLAAEIALLPGMTPMLENDLFRRVDSTKHRTLFLNFLQTAGNLYKRQGDSVKTFLCGNSISQARFDTSFRHVADLLTLARKPHKSLLEDYLLRFIRPELDEDYEREGVFATEEKSYSRDYFDRRAETAEYFLLEVQGTLLLRNNRYREAINILQSVPAKQFNTFEKDPFHFRINDSPKYWDRDTVGDTYTKLTLARRMLNLEKQSNTHSRKAAEAHFLLGNGCYYSFTFAEDPNAYFISGTWYPELGSGENGHEKALIHYKEGMRLALKYGDKELAAKCCFGASKCEQDEYYVSSNGDAEQDLLYRNYFRMLKKDYSKTKYYKEVLKECSYFKYFADHH